MKIVVLDKPRENPGEIDWSALYKLGNVEMNDRVPQNEALEHIKDADIILLNKTNITDEMLEKCENLKFISVIATGYNTVNVNAAKSRGIGIKRTVLRHRRYRSTRICFAFGNHQSCWIS